MALFEPAVTKTIKREGGDKLTNDPTDPGGPTKFGIAQNFHPHVDVRNLTEDGAKAIYRAEYWDPIQADAIYDQAVAEMLFDAAVNPGVTATIGMIRVALGLPPSDRMEPIVIATLNSTPAHEFAAAFTLAKIARYITNCIKVPSKKKYFFGWVVRALGGMA